MLYPNVRTSLFIRHPTEKKDLWVKLLNHRRLHLVII